MVILEDRSILAHGPAFRHRHRHCHRCHSNSSHSGSTQHPTHLHRNPTHLHRSQHHNHSRGTAEAGSVWAATHRILLETSFALGTTATWSNSITRKLICLLAIRVLSLNESYVTLLAAADGDQLSSCHSGDVHTQPRESPERGKTDRMASNPWDSKGESSLRRRVQNDRAREWGP
jgi:hypothetical protein